MSALPTRIEKEACLPSKQVWHIVRRYSRKASRVEPASVPNYLALS